MVRSSSFHQNGKIFDQIYAAAAEPARWPEALGAVADHIGAIGGFISYNAPVSELSFLICGRLDEEISRLSVERHLWNPWTQAMAKTPARKPVTMRETIKDMPALRASAFWADVMAPLVIEEAVAWAEPSLLGNGSAGGFGFCLGSRTADRAEAAARQVAPLLPHLSRSLEISIQLGRHADGARQLERVLQLMPGASLLLDGQGRIAYANPAAETMLRDGDGVTVTANGGLHLTAALPTQRRALERAVRAALAVAAGADDELATSLRLSRPSERAPLIVLLFPLPPPAFELWQVSGACVLVLIADPAALPRRAGALPAIFGLTAAEARVAALVGSGVSAPLAAEQLGLSLATVKTHLSRCYDKIGIRSQPELVRLLSILPV